MNAPRFAFASFAPLATRALTTAPVIALIAALATTLSGCIGEIANAGSPLNPQRLALIAPGEASRNDVQKILGTPSHIPPFDESQPWYYIYKRTSTFAFFEPEILEQHVLAIRFGDDDKVDDIQFYPRERAIEVAMLDRVTPTQGRSLTFLDQLFSSYARLPDLSGEVSRSPDDPN